MKKIPSYRLPSQIGLAQIVKEEILKYDPLYGELDNKDIERIQVKVFDLSGIALQFNDLKKLAENLRKNHKPSLRRKRGARPKQQRSLFEVTA